MQTTDPGRAMITGKWADVSLFKGPVLPLSCAPAFHNGSAATLEEVLEFYERRFHVGLTPQERADLLAFLRAVTEVGWRDTGPPNSVARSPLRRSVRATTPAALQSADGSSE
jgi:cytochrome c peroxidase